jgi:hypothetical protein
MAKKPRIKKSSALKVVKTVAGRLDNLIIGSTHDAPSSHPVHDRNLLDRKFKEMKGE